MTIPGLLVPITGYEAPTSYPGLTLKWADEFTALRWMPASGGTRMVMAVRDDAMGQ